MLYLRLLPFIATLALKNVKSWTRVLLALFGFHVFVIVLLMLNSLLGGLLYLEMKQYQHLQSQLVHQEQRVEKHRQFWQKTRTEFPTHLTAIEAEQIFQEYK